MNELPVSAGWRGHHAALRVPDYAAGIDWYTRTLGLRVLAEWPFGDLKLAFLAPPGDDSFRIELFGDGSPSPVEARPWTDLADSLKYRGFHHVCFSVPDVDATVARLRSLGVPIALEPTDIPPIRSRIAFLSDPWGNFVELAQVLPG
jgi:glyoxylase I family protein